MTPRDDLGARLRRFLDAAGKVGPAVGLTLESELPDLVPTPACAPSAVPRRPPPARCSPPSPARGISRITSDATAMPSTTACAISTHPTPPAELRRPSSPTSRRPTDCSTRTMPASRGSPTRSVSTVITIVMPDGLSRSSCRPRVPVPPPSGPLGRRRCAGRRTRQPQGELMRIATWNVNSIRARSESVVEWMEQADVDVLAMQETKCHDDAFPLMSFLASGYDVAHVGQGAYNGVAIASRVGLDGGGGRLRRGTHLSGRRPADPRGPRDLRGVRGGSACGACTCRTAAHQRTRTTSTNSAGSTPSVTTSRCDWLTIRPPR